MITVHEAVKHLVAAITDEGPHPQQHQNIMERHRREWQPAHMNPNWILRSDHPEYGEKK